MLFISCVLVLFNLLLRLFLLVVVVRVFGGQLYAMMCSCFVVVDVILLVVAVMLYPVF